MHSTIHKAIPSPGISSHESEIEATPVVEEPVPCTEEASSEGAALVVAEFTPWTEVASFEEAASVKLDLPIGTVKNGKKDKKKKKK